MYIVRRSKVLAIALTLVFLTTAQTSCDKNRIHEAAKASDRIATLVGAAIDLKRQLAATGQITPAEELRLTQSLLTVAQRGKQFNEFARKQTQDTPEVRLALAEAFNAVTNAVNKLSNESIFPIKDPEARKRFLAILNSINVSIQVIDMALRG